MPLDCLEHLSTLTELRDLVLDLPFSGTVPQQGVFDRMLRLTRLHFFNKWGGWQEAGEEEAVPFVTLPWRRPAPPGHSGSEERPGGHGSSSGSEGQPGGGGGNSSSGGGGSCEPPAAPLLDLQLQASILGIPPSDVLPTLCQLTALALADIEMDAGDEIDDAWMAALPRLEKLQRLGFWKVRNWAAGVGLWLKRGQAGLACSRLVRLLGWCGWWGVQAGCMWHQLCGHARPLAANYPLLISGSRKGRWVDLDVCMFHATPPPRCADRRHAAGHHPALAAPPGAPHLPHAGRVGHARPRPRPRAGHGRRAGLPCAAGAGESAACTAR